MSEFEHLSEALMISLVSFYMIIYKVLLLSCEFRTHRKDITSMNIGMNLVILDYHGVLI